MTEPPRPPEFSAGESDPESTIDPAVLNPPPAPGMPISIEGYRLLDEISRGGQAIVYGAIFLRTGRKVAVKVMREGPLATEGGRARFTREAQILASLNHPNIVTILDRGRTADGSEYFAMDFIDGMALDGGTWKSAGYMESIGKEPAKPLQLFLKICDAVNAAHLRGIVHRDLKPSNIRLDERGEPHVLDFGLARGSMLNDSQAAAGEPLTITGQFLGSLPWASPEQAEGIGQKIDMRSDVYSLGVVLYQLVTGGHFPYQVVGSMRDVLNNIMTAEPPAPSVVAAGREARDLKRQARRAGPPTKLLNPVLDAIVLRALAKRRDDRYQSAGELARDIECYLAGRPTVADGQAPRVDHRRRNVAAAAVAIVAGALVAGYGVSKLGGGPKAHPEAPTTVAAATEAATTVAMSGPAPATNAHLHPLVAASPLAKDYQDLERVMNRFVAIGGYLHENAPGRMAAWRAAAENGDAVGQMLLGRCYEMGEGIPQNGAEGTRNLRQAVNQGLPMAMCMLGIRYRASLPPNQDFAQAIEWYKRAADAGNARAMVDLGVMAMQGQGTAVDYAEAMRWLQKGADAGAPAAYSYLGDLYRYGYGVPMDQAQAAACYQRAAENDVISGMANLGQAYVSGRGVPQDYGQAMKWFKREDELGAAWAGMNIGDLYAHGQGVPQNYQAAAQWYQKSANNNYALAMRKLAALYEEGNGVSKDHNLAVVWYTKAAGAGDAEAKQWVAANGGGAAATGR